MLPGSLGIGDYVFSQTHLLTILECMYVNIHLTGKLHVFLKCMWYFGQFDRQRY